MTAKRCGRIVCKLCELCLIPREFKLQLRFAGYDPFNRQRRTHERKCAMKRKVVAILLLSMTLTFTVAGCGSTAASATSTTTQSSVSTESSDENTVYGQVSSIDGTTVEVTIGEMGEGNSFTAGSETATYDLSSATIQQSVMGGAPGGTAPSGTPPTGSSDGTDSSTSSDAAGGTATDGTAAGTTDGSTDTSGSTSSDSTTDTAQTPPSMPSGSTDGSTDSGTAQTPPSMPSGSTDSGSGAPSGMPEGQTEDATTDDIAEGDILKITLNDDGTVDTVTIMPDGMGGGQGQSFGGSGEVTQGDAANTISEDSSVSDTSYESTGDDENALRVDGATVTLDGITVNKTDGASSNTEDGDFYGMNAGLLVTNGASATITNATVNTSAQNGNGVFSYGEGTTVTISDSTITTTADNSGGIQTTGGGTTNASNLTVETSGNSSAAIRSDRGGGTVTVDGGTYTTNGYNSPAVYSTAAITVSDAALTANQSEALVIEGQNSIDLTDCDVVGNMSDTEGTSSSINVHNVMIYQSMSGDAEEGESSFSMTGGTLTSKNGDMIYVTNTDCTIDLSGVTVTNEDSEANFLTVSGNDASSGWGTAGQNGGNVKMNLTDQTLSGNITVDTISTLDLTLSGSTDYTGAINIVDNEEGGDAVDNNAVVTVEEGSTWTLTGDCTITSLVNSGTINYNGYTITLADGTVLSE